MQIWVFYCQDDEIREFGYHPNTLKVNIESVYGALQHSSAVSSPAHVDFLRPCQISHKYDIVRRIQQQIFPKTDRNCIWLRKKVFEVEF